MRKKTSWESFEGSSYPLGVHYIKEEDALNFAIYSRHATEVSLFIYNSRDFSSPILRYDLDYRINKSNRIWHCRIGTSQISGAKYYAYKINGPNPLSQFEWHAFDKEKILLDPYAKSVFFPPDFDENAACLPGANDGKAPLGVIMRQTDDFDWQNDTFIHRESDLVIYELHVRGFTMHPSSGMDENMRGTYRGVIEKIPYLKELGITAVELMPVHQFDIINSYWGYNTLNFFSPHSRYSSVKDPSGQISEFKTMVRELHKAGIEVILDVVYNHTAEGDHLGPVYSYKGIDNSTYYLISDNLKEPYFNYAGTGNTLHARNSLVRQLILDSLHYWRSEMHIDGFRFDLASVFNRNADGTISFEEPAVLGMISSDPDLATARFIAEPWDAAGVFNLGKKFPGVKWMQWNSLFRDDVRRFIKGDEGFMADFMGRLYGSADLFPDDLANAFHAYQSINYVNSHDGFTLYDLVSYNQKHNEANGQHNADGADNNYSWNCGIEGNEDISEEVRQLRRRQAKNFCTILFISNGTPMFVAGDEFLRTQRGNNNPYNQDNDTSWINWSFREKNADFFRFFKKMLHFRLSHPSLARSRFWRNDIQWFGCDGEAASRSLAFYLAGRSENDNDIYVMINAYWESVPFVFQTEGPWCRVVDTALQDPDDFVEEGNEVSDPGYLMGPRAVAVFIRKNLT